MLTDMTLVAVIFHRDLEIAVHKVGPCDEIAFIVVDGELPLGLGKAVLTQQTHEHELALALRRRVRRVTLGEQRAKQLRSLASALSHPAQRDAEFVERRELTA